MTRIPLLFLTGFLGSGKTTLLNRLVREKDFSNTAVVINEAGLVGLDHLLIERGDDGVVLLEGGCLCCRMDGALSVALAALLRRRRPDGTLPFARVIVETSGLADPGPILQSLIADIVFNRHFIIAGVVTVIDGRAFTASLAHHPEAAMQVVLADRLLITKSDVADAAMLAHVRDELARLNDHAACLLVRDDARAADFLWTDAFDLVRVNEAAAMPRRDRATEIVTASRRFAGSIAAADFDDWLEHVLSLFGPALLRLKAIVTIAGTPEPVVLHAVQGLLHGFATAPEADAAENRIVLIGRDIDQAMLDDVLRDLDALAGPTGGRTAEALPSTRPC